MRNFLAGILGAATLFILGSLAYLRPGFGEVAPTSLRANGSGRPRTLDCRCLHQAHQSVPPNVEQQLAKPESAKQGT